MNEETEKALDRLETQIQKAHGFARITRDVPGALLLHQTLLRYTFWSVQTGGAILGALRAKYPFAVAPLHRHLLEAQVEVMQILVWPHGFHDAAARCYAWDVLEWHHQREQAMEATGRFPDRFPDWPRDTSQSAEDAMEKKAQKLDQLGGDGDRLRRVWEEVSAKKRGDRLHWSGHTKMDQRLAFLEDRVPGSGSLEEMCAWLEFFWKRLSRFAHPAPLWSEFRFWRTDEGQYLATPEKGELAEIRDRADLATKALGVLGRLVPLFYSERPVDD